MKRRGIRAWIVGGSAAAAVAAAGQARGQEAIADIAPALAAPPTLFDGDSASFSLSVPAYSSRPEASARIYLDFDGDYTPVWGAYRPGLTPAYSTDSDTSTFSQPELNNIREIWMRVAEKYSPFNIDVTTVDPGNLDQRKKTLRVVIGGDGKNGQASYWCGSRAGGIAYLGGFYNSYTPNTAFVFPGNLGNGTPKYTAEASAHEAGHGFGLQHQSRFDDNGNKTDEYNPGDSARAPIMGLSYYSTRGLWWNGPSYSATSLQNDLEILPSSTNGFGYRPDDHGNSVAAATPMTSTGPASVSAFGVIETVQDRDFFSFATGAGNVSFLLSGAQYGAMLDASLALYSSDGALLKLVDTASLGEMINMTLPLGSYDLAVLSAGDFGDIGQYSIVGTIVPIPEPAGAAILLLPAALRRRRIATRPRPVSARSS